MQNIIKGIFFQFCVICIGNFVSAEGFDTLQSRGFSISDFPLRVGTVWVYEHVDTTVYDRPANMTVTVETVAVKIIDETVVTQEKSIYTLLRSIDDKADTHTVILSAESLYATSRLGWLWPLLIFPLKIGKTWTGIYQFDTYEVVSKGEFKTPFETYPNAFKIERKLSIPNDYSTVLYRIVPDIGIVDVYCRQIMTFKQEWNIDCWRLIKFH